jgi:hypothetical protein
MRRFFRLYDKNGDKLNYPNSKHYTYNEYDDLVPVPDMDEESGVIISNYPNLRDRDYITDNIRRTATETLGKLPNTNSFSLKRFTNDTSGVIVSQGINIDPIVKTFESVFQSVVYKVDSAEALIFEGNTMNPTFFEDYTNVNNSIFEGKYVNKFAFYDLEIKRIVNEINLYTSSKIHLDFTPVDVVLREINGIDTINENISDNFFNIEHFVVGTAYELDVRLIYTFHIVNEDDTVRTFKCRVEEVLEAYSDLLRRYRFYPEDLIVDIKTDDLKIFMGDIEVRTSFTAKGEYVTNYVINDVDTLRVLHNYNTEVRGPQNQITANIPINIITRNIDISEHHGYYINSNRELVGFGQDLRGELSSHPAGRFKQVACGKFHNVAINEEDELVSWGENRFHQIDDTPQGKFKKVYAYGHMSAGISDTGDLFIWGDTIFYDSDLDSIMNDVDDIGIGDKFILILKTDGTIIGIGDDSYGQISEIPTGVDDWESIDCGRYHACAKSKNNRFYAWGKSDDNQLSGTNITQEVRSCVCTEYGGVVILTDDTLKGFGSLVNTNTGKYTNVISGYDNIILLSNESYIFEKTMIPHVSSGDAYNLKLTVEIQDLVIHKILSELEILN